MGTEKDIEKQGSVLNVPLKGGGQGISKVGGVGLKKVTSSSVLGTNITGAGSTPLPIPTALTNVSLDVTALITILVALLGLTGGVLSWWVKDFNERKEEVSKLKVELVTLTEKWHMLDIRVGDMESEVSVLEKEAEERLRALEDQQTILFNFLVAISKEGYLKRAELEALEVYLESNFFKLSTATSAAYVSPYRKQSIKIPLDKLEEIKEFIDAYNRVRDNLRNKLGKYYFFPFVLFPFPSSFLFLCTQN